VYLCDSGERIFMHSFIPLLYWFDQITLLSPRQEGALVFEENALH